jgi:hypothetical protein
MDTQVMSISGEWLGHNGVLVLTAAHVVFITNGVVEWKMHRAEVKVRIAERADGCTLAISHRRDRTEVHQLDFVAAVAFADALGARALAS